MSIVRVDCRFHSTAILIHFSRIQNGSEVGTPSLAQAFCNKVLGLAVVAVFAISWRRYTAVRGRGAYVALMHAFEVQAVELATPPTMEALEVFATSCRYSNLLGQSP